MDRRRQLARDNSRNSIHLSLAHLYRNDKYSDLVVTCHGRTFNVHRAIVCPQSPFFDRACSGGFRETHERTIDLPDDDPDALDKFFEYLYTGVYTESSIPEPVADDPNEAQRDPLWGFQLAISGFDEDHRPARSRRQSEDQGDFSSSLLLSLRMYTMAQKYVVPDLKTLAENRFLRTAKYQSMKAAGFVTVVEELFERTSEDDELRNFVYGLVASQVVDPEVRDRLRDVMLAHPIFAVSVLDKVVDFGYNAPPPMRVTSMSFEDPMD